MQAIIIKNGLSEEEAYIAERDLIRHYVFELGYGIDIDGYRGSDPEHRLSNHTFGGDGSFGMVHTESWKLQHSMDMQGEKNPMYGINVWNRYDEKKRMQ